MTYQEAMNQLTRLRSQITAGGDDSVFSPDDREIIEELHRLEFGKPVRECNCRDRYADAVMTLYKSLKSRQTMASEQKYRLRPGVLIWVGTEVYSRHNLTDEIAAAYLAQHPEDRGKFERIPKEHKSKAVKTLLQNNEQEG